MILQLAWRNVWRNKLRSGIMIASMVFGLLGVMLMVGFVRAMVGNMIENAIQYDSGHFQVHHADFLLNEELKAYLPEADKMADGIRKVPGVLGVSVRHVVDGMIGSAAATRGVRINGVRVQDEAGVTSLEENIVEGTTLPEVGRNPILVSRRLAEKLKLRLKSKAVLTFSDIRGDVTGAAFRVGGFFETPSSIFDEGNVFVRKKDIASITGLAESHEIAVLLENSETLEAVKPALAAITGDGGVLRDWREIQPVLAAMVNSLGVSNSILIGVFILALGFGIVNAMMMSVFERTREFGMLMAIGMNNSKIVWLIMLEALFLGAVGSICGVLASAVILAVANYFGLPFGVVAEGLGAFGVDTVLYPTVPLVLYPTLVGVIMVTSLLAALYPTRQIVKKRPHTLLAEKH